MKKRSRGFGMGMGDVFGGQSDPKNPTITGAGRLSGGRFESLTVTGAGKVDGDVHAKNVNLSGSAKISGNVTAGEFVAAGSVDVAGRLEAKSINSAGALNVGRGIQAGTLDATGAFSSGGDVEATAFRARGGFTVRGRIKADSVDIEIGGRCRADAIQAPRITVTRGSSGGGGGGAVSVSVVGQGASVSVTSSASSTSSGERILDVDRIEGTTVSLEATRARTVKGARVTIGAECQIDRVEYTEEFKATDGAKVGESVKVGK